MKLKDEIKTVLSVHVDVNETKEYGDNQSSFQASLCTMYLKMILHFPFICNMTSKKIINVTQLVLFSRELNFNVFEDDVTLSFHMQHDVKETK